MSFNFPNNFMRWVSIAIPLLYMRKIKGQRGGNVVGWLMAPKDIRTCKCYLIWKRGSVRMWLNGGFRDAEIILGFPGGSWLQPHVCIPLTERQWETWRRRGDHVTTDAETGVIWLQAKESQLPRKLEGARASSSATPWFWPSYTDSGILNSRTVGW